MALPIFGEGNRTKLYILGGIIVLIILILLVVVLVRGFTNVQSPPRVVLQFWGVFDEPAYFSQAFQEYQRRSPNVSIVYRKFNFDDYEKQLIDAFAAGTGPDIWLMHNTWLPKHGDKIQPLPQNTSDRRGPAKSFKDFQTEFVEVAISDLTRAGEIYALPIYVDSLALYYNRELFNNAGIATPPADWEKFNETVQKLTSIDEASRIVKAGAAMGTARNINRSTDILTLLMMQSGVQMTDWDNIYATFASTANVVSQVALQYYVDFANPAKQVYTWNDQQHYSIDAFSEGKVAMMLNYSHHIQTLRAKSPRLNFAVAPIPQITGSTSVVNYANYWVPTVSKQSKNADEAWYFLAYLSSAEGAAMYVNASGRPAARRDIIQAQQLEPDIGIFATQALSTRSWYQADNTAIETILAEMIDDVNFGRAAIRDALQSAESKVNVVMQRSKRGP